MASSVSALVASPLAKGLFVRAIAESGGALNASRPVPSLAQSEKAAGVCARGSRDRLDRKVAEQAGGGNLRSSLKGEECSFFHERRRLLPAGKSVSDLFGRESKRTCRFWLDGTRTKEVRGPCSARKTRRLLISKLRCAACIPKRRKRQSSSTRHQRMSRPSAQPKNSAVTAVWDPLCGMARTAEKNGRSYDVPL